MQKYHRISGFNHRILFLQFWGLKVQDQDVRVIDFSCSFSSWLVWLPSCCVLTWPFLSVHAKRKLSGVSSRLIRTPVLIRAPPLGSHLIIITCLKALTANAVALGIGASAYEWG